MFPVLKYSFKPQGAVMPTVYLSRLQWATTSPAVDTGATTDGVGFVDAPFSPVTYVPISGQTVGGGGTMVSVDSFTIDENYGPTTIYMPVVTGGGFSPRNVATRYVMDGEIGIGSLGNRFSVWLFPPQATVSTKTRIKTVFYQKCPTSGWHQNIKDTNLGGATDIQGIEAFWAWGSIWVGGRAPVRGNPTAAAVNTLNIGKGNVDAVNELTTLAYTFTPGTWYRFIIDCFKDGTNGFVNVYVSQGNGSNLQTFSWNGNTGTNNEVTPWSAALGRTNSMVVFSKPAFNSALSGEANFTLVEDVGIADF